MLGKPVSAEPTVCVCPKISSTRQLNAANRPGASAITTPAGICAAIRDADHTEMVKRISVPTLCVTGEHDGATPPALVRSMADLIPGAEFRVIEGAGHIPCVEEPEELVSLMREFLERRAGHG